MSDPAIKHCERALASAKNRTGMIVGLPKATVDASMLEAVLTNVAAMTKARDEWKAKAEANERDAERLLMIAGPNGFIDGIGDFDFHEGAAGRALENGHDEPNSEDYLAAIRFGIDDAYGAEKEKE